MNETHTSCQLCKVTLAREQLTSLPSPPLLDGHIMSTMKRPRVDSMRGRRLILPCSSTKLFLFVCCCLLAVCRGGYPYRQARPPDNDSIEYPIRKRSLKKSKGRGYSSKSKSRDYYYDHDYDPYHSNIFSRPQDRPSENGKGGFWGSSKSKSNKYWYTSMPTHSAAPSNEPSASQQPSVQPSLPPSPEPTISQQPTLDCYSKSSKSGKGKRKRGKRYGEHSKSKKSSKKKTAKSRDGSLSRSTKHPTVQPTAVPTGPTTTPTENPTKSPTKAPTRMPTSAPAEPPTRLPTRLPTRSPTAAPVVLPTVSPTQTPVTSPTMVPISVPTVAPTTAPMAMTTAPTMPPVAITDAPTVAPTVITDAPTQAPITVTEVPTRAPIVVTKTPTQDPTAAMTAPPTPDNMKDTDTPTTTPRTASPATEAPSAQLTSPPTPPVAATQVPTMVMTTAPVAASETESPVQTMPTVSPAPVSNTQSPATDVPTKVPAETPTAAPVLTVDPTASPTSVPTRGPNMFRVDLTPWALTYETTSTLDPLEQDFEAAEALTLGYLEEFMRATFEFVPDTAFEDLLGSATGVALFPSRIGYETSVQFSESSAFVPTKDELEQLLAIAFEQPNVDALYMTLSTLPSTNPFSTTTDIIFASAETSRDAASPLGPETITTIAGICLLSVLLVMMLSLRTRRHATQRFKYERALQKLPTDPYFNEVYDSLAKTCSDTSPSDPGLELEKEEVEIAFYTSRGRDHENRMTPYDPLLRVPEFER